MIFNIVKWTFTASSVHLGAVAWTFFVGTP
jgi:hypothetical protein